jgi:hypothetical protein
MGGAYRTTMLRYDHRICALPYNMAEQEADPTPASQPHTEILTFPYPTPSDVKMLMECTHNGITQTTEIHAHADILIRNEWFATCLKKNAFKVRSQPPQPTSHPADPLATRKVKRRLYAYPTFTRSSCTSS